MLLDGSDTLEILKIELELRNKDLALADFIPTLRLKLTEIAHY
jgi:hypothetical protein